MQSDFTLHHDVCVREIYHTSHQLGLTEAQPWGFSRVHMISLSFLIFKSRNIYSFTTALLQRNIYVVLLKQESRERVQLLSKPYDDP